ncbi:PP2C family protein-serine/threonine phosphatase [Leptospira sp. GIMC2001]|uniref:PP2C family protein-serine/threonine phosphatase n=1 Tax=Leptospira sp. GIMC2001 TaxID=1513297 RepID=UPI00234A832A|nr:PP2C family protein-serine/threonine phosphatase [Leptospira sp. GIMC2001]WCL48551.1 PP2C family protein-serine/threonine phosphatase [Leptospira sp. GIMC2001]
MIDFILGNLSPKISFLSNIDKNRLFNELLLSNYRNAKTMILILITIHIPIFYIDYSKYNTVGWIEVPTYKTIFLFHLALIGILALILPFILYCLKNRSFGIFGQILTLFIFSFVYLWSLLFSINDFFHFKDFSIYIIASFGLPLLFRFRGIVQVGISLAFHLIFISLLFYYSTHISEIEGVLTNSSIAMILSIVVARVNFNYKVNEYISLATIQNQNDRINQQIQIIQNDIEMASEIQINTLPKIDSLKDLKIDIDLMYLALEKVSGDFYDFFQRSKNSFRIFIADATGHGIQAALITMIIKTEYERIKDSYDDPKEILNRLNVSILSIFKNTEAPYSCFIIDIDYDKKLFQYSSAGHPTQLLFNGKEIMELNSLSPMLGFRNDISILTNRFPLEESFKLFLYTDGLTESYIRGRDIYGLKNLKDAFSESRDLNAKDTNHLIYQKAKSFLGSDDFTDDVTLISIVDS